MRPLFTIHAGEFVVGEYIENSFPGLNIWIPAKDTGIDLLVTGESNKKSVTLQVKLSRDYNAPQATSDFERNLFCAGWLSIDSDKLAKSLADFWVIVLLSNERRQKPQFVVIPPKELLRRLEAIHGRSKRYQFYPWVTKKGECLEGRGLRVRDEQQLADGKQILGERDLTAYLNNWGPVELIVGKK